MLSLPTGSHLKVVARCTQEYEWAVDLAQPSTLEQVLPDVLSGVTVPRQWSQDTCNASLSAGFKLSIPMPAHDKQHVSSRMARAASCMPLFANKHSP
jgi:hypothetical protein